MAHCSDPADAGPLELLAPAGDPAALEAALDAGASSVYFGFATLNARRGAGNFRQEQFAPAVAAVHARGAKAYLTLNIDLADRELGQAVRMLELARQSGADAVLVRDSALLAFRPLYPELAFHFSTQTCMANSADVAAAGEWGAARVVLAREMSLPEIAAASAVPGVETEVFVQGALCFCISGRCLLSSWVGGHSGNRGVCTSPCRVPWTASGAAVGTPFSMRDLSAIRRLEALRRAGVSALKIEGRLRTAVWVRQAVTLYRRALDGEKAVEKGSDPFILDEAAQLGQSTGRLLTCGYLDAERDALTGVADRAPCADGSVDGAGEDDLNSSDEAESDAPRYDFQMTVQPRGVECQCTCGGRSISWSIPKTVVRRAHKASSIGQLLAWLESQTLAGARLEKATTNDTEFLLVPRAVNALVDRITAAIRQARKAPDEMLRIELPPAVRAVLEKDAPHAANQRCLGETPDRVRLDVHQVGPFVTVVRPEGIIVEGLSGSKLDKLLALARGVPLVVALPSVFFESEIKSLDALLRGCAAAGVTAEVNSWGGWRLARQAGVTMEAGPGLAVLNSLAARVLGDAGMRCITLSLEADRRRLEEATAHCPTPCALIVYGRPALMITRVRVAEEFLGQVCEDRRGVKMIPQRHGHLTAFRPVEAFDLRGLSNAKIRVRHLVADLVGAADPVGDWYDSPAADTETFRFNYDRGLF